MEGLTASEVAGVEEWANTYKRDYTPAGKVVGHFYDAEGNPTAALWKARELLRQNKVRLGF